jgi:hypothetical protein
VAQLQHQLDRQAAHRPRNLNEVNNGKVVPARKRLQQQNLSGRHQLLNTVSKEKASSPRRQGPDRPVVQRMRRSRVVVNLWKLSGARHHPRRDRARVSGVAEQSEDSLATSNLARLPPVVPVKRYGQGKEPNPAFVNRHRRVRVPKKREAQRSADN